MTLSPLVLFVLLACWMVPAVLLLAQYWAERTRTTASTPQRESADVVIRRIPIDVSVRAGDPKQALYTSESETDWMPDPSTGTVMVLEAPYAECRVRVLDAETEAIAQRQCMLCIN